MLVCSQLWRITVISVPSGAECFQVPDDDENKELNFTEAIISNLFKPLPPVKAGQKWDPHW